MGSVGDKKMSARTVKKTRTYDVDVKKMSARPTWHVKKMGLVGTHLSCSSLAGKNFASRKGNLTAAKAS